MTRYANRAAELQPGGWRFALWQAQDQGSSSDLLGSRARRRRRCGSRTAGFAQMRALNSWSAAKRRMSAAETEPKERRGECMPDIFSG
jgi:hypothetical protein